MSDIIKSQSAEVAAPAAKKPRGRKKDTIQAEAVQTQGTRTMTDAALLVADAQHTQATQAYRDRVASNTAEFFQEVRETGEQMYQTVEAHLSTLGLSSEDIYGSHVID